MALRQKIFSLIWLAAIVAATTDAIAIEQPNIVIILADDMGYGDASCYGGWIETPNLDRLAEEGLRFTDFHSSGVVCSPTRAGLMTGRYQQRAGIPGVINADPEHPSHVWGLDPHQVTFSKLLKQSGYTTGLFGKWHLGYDQRFNPAHHGFDEFRGFVSGNIDYHSHFDRMGTYDWWDGLEPASEAGYTTHLITNHAVDFIHRNRERPFCLYVSHAAIHSPWQTPDDPPVRGAEARKIPERDNKPVVARMMRELDSGVGKIIDAIRTKEIDRQTLVFFFSDNGPAGGSAGPWRGRKASLFEGGHRVPAIAWWPEKISPGVTDELAISLDLMPTVLSLASIQIPTGHELDGVDLTPLLFQSESLEERVLVWQHGSSHAVREGRWKAIFTPQNTWLFDLSSDPGEKSDVSSEHPDHLQRMREHLETWRKDTQP